MFVRWKIVFAFYSISILLNIVFFSQKTNLQTNREDKKGSTTDEWQLYFRIPRKRLPVLILVFVDLIADIIITDGKTSSQASNHKLKRHQTWNF
mgnify:FL=1